MDVLEHLGLRRGRITAEQDIDVASVFGRATLFETLVRASEELEKNALLHIVHFVDRRCQRSRKQLVDVWPSGSSLDLFLFFLCNFARLLDAASNLIRELLLDCCRIDAHSSLVDLLHVQTINVRLEDVLHGPLPRVDANLVAFKDTGYLDSITGLTNVNQLIVSAERDGVRRLSIWHCIRSLLKLDYLLVRKSRSIVHNLHAVGSAANFTRTSGWLSDLATVDVDFQCMMAHRAAEEGVLHVGNDWRCADDQTLDGDKLVHVIGVEVSKVDRLVETERPHAVDSLLTLSHQILFVCLLGLSVAIGLAIHLVICV